jgi:glutathione S-transferase
MVIKVHGVVQSTCTRRVLTALIEKGVPYELVAVNFQAAEHKSAPFLAMQPFGKIPVLDDDGFLVYESRAICKYIAKKYASQGTKLIPAEDDLKGYALFEQVSPSETLKTFAEGGARRARLRSAILILLRHYLLLRKCSRCKNFRLLQRENTLTS